MLKQICSAITMVMLGASVANADCLELTSYVNAVENINATPEPQEKLFCPIDNSARYKYPVRAAISDGFTDGQIDAFAAEDWLGLFWDVLEVEKDEFAFGYNANTVRNIVIEGADTPSHIIVGATVDAPRLIGAPSQNNLRLKISSETGQIECIKFPYRACRPLGSGSGSIVHRMIESERERAVMRRQQYETFIAAGAPGSVPQDSWPADYSACMNDRHSAAINREVSSQTRFCPAESIQWTDEETGRAQCLERIEGVRNSEPNWPLHHVSCSSLWR